MKRNGRLLLYGFILLALYICPLAVEAQDYVYATGNPNFGVNYPVSAGQVDITNGNVHLSIPLGSFAQRGGLPPININLEYDSRIWKIVENNGSYSWQPINVPNSMDGWRLTTGLEQGTTSYNEYFEQNSQTATCKVNGLYVYDFSESWTLINGFSWKDSEGTNHVFEAQTEQPVQVCDGDTNYTHPTASGYATDGSGLFVEITNYTQMVIYDNTGNEVYPVRKDPNGNTVTIDASGTITDSMGRVLLTTTTSGSTITYNVIKEGGGTNTYTVQTEPVQLSTSFAQQAVSEFTGSLTSIQSIGLPDGHSYSFTYDSGTAAGNYGELGTMTLPTGGVSSLSYINYTDSYNNANRWISTETEDNKIVSFAPQVISQCSSGTVGCVEQMTMTRPAGDYRVYTLTMNNGAWDGQTDIYQGTSKLVTIKNNYDFSHSCSSSSICTGAEYITASSSSVTLDDTGQVANTLYTYAAPWIGKVSSVQEFDYGVSGTPSRETDYTYGYTINGAYLLTQESSLYKGAAFGLKVYGYDYAANVLKETRGLSGQAQAITTYTYDGNGMKTSEIDPNNNTTTFQYSCNDGFLSQTTYPQTGSVAHIEKVAPDCSSGYPLSKTDENNQIVTYEYDSIGRKSSITYPTGGGSTTYSYPSATEVDETKLISSGVSSTSVTTWDPYGKKSETSDTDPAGSDSVQYTYDLDNRLASTTNAQRTTPQPTDGKTQYVYDALDRVTLITQPDGQKI